MGSTIQEKLLNHEVAPPETVWERIAGELEDAGTGMQFPQMLRELSVDPPAGCWEQINYQLDETALNGKMAEKLYAAEVFPPVSVWNTIASALDDNTSKNTAPEHRQRSAFWKYAAAALLIGFTGYALLQFLPFNQKRISVADSSIITDMEAGSHSQAGIDAALQHENESTHLNSNIESDANNDAALEASKKTYASLDFNRTPKASLAAALTYEDYMNPEELGEHGNLGFSEAVASTDNKDSRYIVLMTPDGHFIRMSKKLSNLVCCVAGEEADKNCESQLEKWRKQIACSAASHPGNFMDILSLVNTLQDQ